MYKTLITLTLVSALPVHALGSRNRNSAPPPAAPTAQPVSTTRTSATQIKRKNIAPKALPSTAPVGQRDILKYADSGVGSPYVWGGSAWSTTNRKILGADCSGFTQKAWGYPRVLKTDEELPGNKRLTTKEFMQAQDAGYPWTRLNGAYANSQPGDAMVWRGDDSGHIFLVSKAENSGVVTLEARGKKYGIGYSRKSYAYLKNKGYKTLRHQ